MLFANEYANANYPDKRPESHRQSVPLHCWLCLHLPPARRQQSLDRLPVQINNPMELQVPPRAVVGASAPRLGNASGKVDVHRHRQGFFLGLALSCTPFAAYLNSELFPLVTFRTHRRRVSAAANENDQHVQNTRWSFL